MSEVGQGSAGRAPSGGRHGRAPSGGRHDRAHELIERRERGEGLSDYDQRVLDAHLAACAPCRQWAERRTVGGGQEEAARATVDDVEAATPSRDTGGGKRMGSSKDAMGKDKHRQVVGHSWGPSRTRQLLYYGIFIAFLIAAYIGGKIAIDQLDKAPAHSSAKAPWSQPNAPQIPPQKFQ